MLLVNNSSKRYVLVILVVKSPKLETGPKSLLAELRQSTITPFFLTVFLILFKGGSSLLLLLLLTLSFYYY